MENEERWIPAEYDCLENIFVAIRHANAEMTEKYGVKVECEIKITPYYKLVPRPAPSAS